MNKTGWIVAVAVAIVFGGGGYWYGTAHAAGARGNFAAGNFTGRTGGTFAGRGGFGAAGGGATIGTILSVGTGSITVQLPNSTSSDATTGTKLVLVNSSTQVDEMQSVGTSKLAQGQSVTVMGSANSDGSITAQSIQIRPAGAFGRGQ